MREKASYGYRDIEPSEKRRLILGHFNTIARRYDLADTLLSFGLHFYWRRLAMRRLDVKPGHAVLDLCAGTADFGVFAAGKAGPEGKVAVCDISRLMMAAGRKKAARARVADRLHWVQGDAEEMCFDTGSFDAVIVGYGIRNFVFLERGLREIRRVLKKNGKFVAMEFSMPEAAWLRSLYHIYSFRVIPVAGKWITGTAEPFHYLAESIRVFPSPEQVREILAANGFVNAGFERVSNGLAVIHYGEG